MKACGRMTVLFMLSWVLGIPNWFCWDAALGDAATSYPICASQIRLDHLTKERGAWNYSLDAQQKVSKRKLHNETDYQVTSHSDASLQKKALEI